MEKYLKAIDTMRCIAKKYKEKDINYRCRDIFDGIEFVAINDPNINAEEFEIILAACSEIISFYE